MNQSGPISILTNRSTTWTVHVKKDDKEQTYIVLEIENENGHIDMCLSNTDAHVVAFVLTEVIDAKAKLV